MLNEGIIMGRLVRDPELRRTTQNTAVASFTVACDRDFASGGAVKETDFIDIVAWDKKAEFICKHFTKGKMIVVCGRIQTRTWEDRDGNKRKNTEIVAQDVYFGESKGESKPAHREFSPVEDDEGLPF